MKYCLLFLVIFSYIFSSASADFGSYTEIKNPAIPTTFTKPHGTNDLWVYEDYFVNPFAGKKIEKVISTCTGNGCNCSGAACTTTYYTINGVYYNPADPIYKTNGDVIKNWSYESNGIYTRIEYIEDATSTIPDQQVKVRKYYRVTFNHDTTPPTCANTILYNDKDGVSTFTYTGGWINTPKYYTMVCEDIESQGCICPTGALTCKVESGKVMTPVEELGHNIKPRANFTNKLNLENTVCEPGGTFTTVMYDRRVPTLEMQFTDATGSVVYDFDVNNGTNRHYWKTLSGAIYDGDTITPGILRFNTKNLREQKAGGKDLHISISDEYTVDSTNGVSGIKNYSIDIFRNKNQTFQDITEQKLTSCSRAETFGTYDIDGSKTTSDVKDIDFSCDELQTSGQYKIVIKAYDWAGNETWISAGVKIYPGDISPSTSSLVLSGSTDLYANNKDEYEYALSLKDSFGNDIINRNLSKIEQSITGYNLGQNILVKSGKSALITRSPDGLKTDPIGKHKLMLKSLKPGTYTERFKVDYISWGNEGIQNQAQKTVFITNTQDNTFLKPFSATLALEQAGAMPQLGTKQRYQITLQNIGTVTSFSKGNLGISLSSIKFSSDHYFDDTFSVQDNAFSTSDYLTYFDATINTKNAQSALLTPMVQSENINISYNLGGETIVYPLDTFSLGGCADISTVGLKVIGNIQGDGKTDLTGQEKNFSNISQSSLRAEIEKNALSLVKGMKSGTTLNKVHYYEGNISISGTLPYETLVVKNGNITITGNLNIVNKQKLGVIVLRDTGFNTAKDFNTSGNIYVTKNVREIYAILYADGVFRSAYPDGTSYEDIDLGLKLDLYGSLFSKNTIGGAINAGGQYILPGSASTTDLQLAKIYDLNYIRRNKTCGPDEYSFLIKYNPNVQVDPPKGFFTK